MRPVACALGAALALAVLPVPLASGLTSHDGWPEINGMLLMNKQDQSRPLDARPGSDPFDGQDDLYQCDGLHKSQDCLVGNATCQTDSSSDDSRGRGGCGHWVVKLTKRHNELLGGHGSDVIHAGPNGDVLWGDFHEDTEQPTSQNDELTGGDGRDFIYASHGHNVIDAGGGNDYVKAHWGRGSVDCGAGRDTLYISHRAMPKYKISGCERVTHKTLGR